jgi:hypothetical protein
MFLLAVCDIKKFWERCLSANKRQGRIAQWLSAKTWQFPFLFFEARHFCSHFIKLNNSGKCLKLPVASLLIITQTYPTTSLLACSKLMLLKAPLALDRKSTGSEYVLIKARVFKIVQNYVLWKSSLYRGRCHVRYQLLFSLFSVKSIS